MIEEKQRQEIKDEEEDDDDEYYKFDSDKNKRRISRSDAMVYSYSVVCQCYQAKGWDQNNGWIENSDGLPVTEHWDPTFKKRFYLIHLKSKANMKQIIATNLGAIPSQEMEA